MQRSGNNHINKGTYLHTSIHIMMQTKDIWKVRWQKTKEVGWYSAGYVLFKECIYKYVYMYVYESVFWWK